jgi:hypothetical protein
MYGTDWMNVRVSASFSVARCSRPMCGSALDHLTVELKHQPQHAVRCRMLRTEVQRVVLDVGHDQRPCP